MIRKVTGIFVLTSIFSVLFWGAHLQTMDALAAGRNEIANAYCVAKGYDQGFMQDDQFACQTITVKQDLITPPQNVPHE